MTTHERGFEGSVWSLAIFSSRESAAHLTEVVDAAANAERLGATLTIDLLVNGNPLLAEEMHARLSSASAWSPRTTVRLWAEPQPDKAATWNRYLHTLLPVSDLAFFMDGYVRLEREALVRMADAMRRRPEALAATCVPTMGPSAPALRRRFLVEGGFHGNLYALRPSTCSVLRATAFRLPAGIYRNDSALGAALAFNLDPAQHPWCWDRIIVVPDAVYRTPVPHALRFADVRSFVKRRLRQAQGTLETRALKAHLNQNRRPPTAWASTARGLIVDWATARPAEARKLLWQDPLAWVALQRLRRAADPAAPADAVRFLGRYPATPERPGRPDERIKSARTEKPGDTSAASRPR